jgi:cellulose synthase/poly-beta-1,6-N-acetylglucosamine synthase-like glycosyltransferase
MALFVIIIYFVLLLFIFLYSLVQIELLYHYFKSKNNFKNSFLVDYTELPKVTIQLPVYNERYVIERLLDCVCNMEYPSDKLQIQVLDDSTDDTTSIIERKIEQLKVKNIPIELIRREQRTGYKAGALAYGLTSATGDYIAIFDADFVPSTDFLMKIIPEFQQEPNLGLVQTRWEHLNKDYSLLTRLQALGLDFHFTLEQVGRNSGGHFMNFNGTAGVWRKSCIEGAGGWSADTLTEDLDLSYRAQLKGWKFKFLEELGAPAELPVTIPALKNQQFRWSKGAAECARKNLFKVLKSKSVRFTTKIHATFHLLNSFLFVDVLIMALLSIPLIQIMATYTEYNMLFYVAKFFIVNTIILGSLYAISVFRVKHRGWLSFFLFLFYFPLFLAFTMGLSLYNGIGVLEGYLGKKSPFVRTPKFNVNNKGDNWIKNTYNIRKVTPVIWIEGLMLLYVLCGLTLAIYYQNLGMIPFMVMLVLGFGFIFIAGIKDTFRAE